MRKNIEIKVTFIFFAWLLIFAHGIIPHNHIDEDLCNHAGYIHESHDPGADSKSVEFRSLCHDYESCNISNILFQKFSSAEDPLLSESRTSYIPIATSGWYILKYDQQIPDAFAPGSGQLRSPPVA